MNGGKKFQISHSKFWLMITSMHMEKYERSFKCSEKGCERLPGFADLTDLLQHECETHNKLAPRNHINCPYENCEYHFREEVPNLHVRNEHVYNIHNKMDFDLKPATREIIKGEEMKG